jgi:PcfJ-like protein
MTGRSPSALLDLVREWRQEAASRRSLRHTEFQPCGLRPGRWEIEGEAGPVVWTMDEILDSSSLVEEGRKMRHCVALYQEAIEKRKCSVWSMRTMRGDLLEEGREMHHCVATYSCTIEVGGCSMWSMKLARLGATERAVTIEVINSTRTIVQVRGKYKRYPNNQERHILELWARENGLKIRLYEEE